MKRKPKGVAVPVGVSISAEHKTLLDKVVQRTGVARSVVIARCIEHSKGCLLAAAIDHSLASGFGLRNGK